MEVQNKINGHKFKAFFVTHKIEDLEDGELTEVMTKLIRANILSDLAINNQELDEDYPIELIHDETFNLMSTTERRFRVSYKIK